VRPKHYTTANKADTPDAAMTLWFHFESRWGGVGDLRRSASESRRSGRKNTPREHGHLPRLILDGQRSERLRPRGTYLAPTWTRWTR
jgi:hypothetical protein